MNYTKEKILISAVMVGIILVMPGNAWMSGWSNRLVINVTNPNSHINFTNHQVNISFSSPSFDFSKTSSNGTDIRFTWVNDSTEQQLSFWIESWNSSSQNGNTTIWIKLPFLNISTTETIYMYYGNTSAISASDSKTTFGSSSANLSIPGCILGEPCIVSTDQIINSSGNYGHPYIRINPGVILSISGSNTIVYFNSTGRFDIFGTLSSTGGGASNGTDGGMYYGRGSGGSGGIGNNGALPGGSYGGGGSAKGGTSCSTGGGNYGGGGGNACDADKPGYGGAGAFLSINSSILNIKPSGSITVTGTNGGAPTGGGGGALLQLLNISTFIIDGAITVIGGNGAKNLVIGWSGGGGALLYLNNYSTTIGTGTFTVRGGDAWASSGGIATLNMQSSSQSSTAGGTVTQQFSIEGQEPIVQVLFFDELRYATSVQPSPTEISDIATLRLNYTYISNSSPVTGATVNLTIFDTTSSRAVLSENLQMTYIPGLGLWQYNYSTLAGVNGTYKYNIKGNVPGLFSSDFDTNGTFDTKDTTAPQISSLSITTSCSGHSNYRPSNAPFDITFSATDNWAVSNYTLCNLTLSNSTTIISWTNTTTCSFHTSGQAGSATARIFVNDSANNTASTSFGVTVVDSCPVASTSPPSSQVSSSGGGSGGGGGISVVSAAVSELPEILFETRALSLVQDQPEKLKITLKNPKREPLTVTLDGPPELVFDSKELTLSAGEEREVYATLSYSTAGNYKPMISAQLGDLKRMYDLSVTVAKKEVDALEQLLMDAQKALNSLANLKGKACDNDIKMIDNKTLTIETLAQAVRRPILLGDKPPDAKVAELKRELSATSAAIKELNECRPTVIQQQPQQPVTRTVKVSSKSFQIPALIAALLFGAGLFKLLRRRG